MEARVGSPHSATSRAEPAVSLATTAFSPSSRIARRHWPSAWTWLYTLARPDSGAPLRPSSWCRIGRKYSATMKSPEAGSSAWISATRPAIVFSIGIIARLARPSVIAASASSKVAQGWGVQPG